MNTLEQDIAELRQRVTRLESLVGQVVGATQPGVPSPVTLPRSVQSAPAPARASTPVHARGLAQLPASVWIAAAGAMIFLIGVSYGLTLSIQRGWISPGVRVAMGLITGLALGVAAARTLLASNRSVGVAVLLAATGTWTFALYYGAQRAQLFPLALGFAGTALATLVAGGLAARARSDGALAVAIATGLAAPVIFGDGSDHLPALLVYLMLLTAAPLVVHYRSGSGGNWRWSRSLATAGTWFVAVVAAVATRPPADPQADLWLGSALGLVVLLRAWLPWHREAPWLPGAATVVSQSALALYAWIIWLGAGYTAAHFSTILVALALSSALLIAPARWRGGLRHDLTLFLLSVAFALLAMAAGLEWDDVVVTWGVSAVLIAWAARSAAVAAYPSMPALQWTAALATVPASLLWIALAVQPDGGGMLFFNHVFLGGALAALAWWPQAAKPGPCRPVAFVALQLVAVIALALELARGVRAVQIDGLDLELGALLSTLVYALAGTGQWLWGLSLRAEPAHARVLQQAGYGWITVAVVKLLGYDLADAELLFRAAAALGVGIILIAASLWAARSRAGDPA